MSSREGKRWKGAAQTPRAPFPLLTPYPLWLRHCLRGVVCANLFIFGRGAYPYYLRVVLAPALPCALNGLS